jgi:hypothetical protein
MLRNIVHPAILVFTLGACDLGPQKLGDSDGVEAESASESESSTGADELICAEFTTPEDCNGKSNEFIECGWGTVMLATRTGDTCEVSEIPFCRMTVNFGDEAAGCGSLEGCNGPFLNPQYRVTPEGVVLIDECGGTHEEGFTACASGMASSDPPECACACELAP